MKNHILFTFTTTLICLSISIPLDAQFEWFVEPIIEYENFNYHPDVSKELITITAENGRQGVMNRNGQVIFEAGTFRRVNIAYENDIFYGIKDEGYNVVGTAEGLILSDGSTLVRAPNNTNILLVRDKRVYGIMDITGQIIREPQYESIKRVRLGLYKGVFSDGTEELIEVSEDCRFQNPESLIKTRKKYGSKDGDLILIRNHNRSKEGLMDIQGDTILPLGKYGGIGIGRCFQTLIFATDLESGKKGALNTDGSIVIPFIYDRFECWEKQTPILIANIGEDYFTFNPDFSVRASLNAKKIWKCGDFPFLVGRMDSVQYLLNYDLKPHLPESFDEIRGPNKSSWSMLWRDKKLGFFSFKNNNYTEPQFDGLSVPMKFDVFGVKTGSKFRLFDVLEGEFLTDSIYTHIENMAGYYLAEYKVTDSIQNDSVIELVEKSYFHVLDQTGDIVYGPTEHRIRVLHRGLWIERINKNKLILHHFDSGKSRIFSDNVPVILRGNRVAKYKKNYILPKTYSLKKIQ